MNAAIQKPDVVNSIKSSDMKVPTQQQLVKWVDETLKLFIAEHAAGRRFTAWEVALHIIAVQGGEYVIPHSDRGNFIGVRSLVYEMMEHFKNVPNCSYELIADTAADGESANFWTPIQPQIAIPAVSQVVITIAKDGDSKAATTAIVAYNVDGFTFDK